LLGGLLLYRREQPLTAGIALSAAVLTRESVLIPIAAIAIVWAVQDRRLRLAPAWLLPLVVFAAWEGVVYAEVSSAPLTHDQSNIGAPFAGIASVLGHWLGDTSTRAAIMRIGVFALLLWTLALAAASLARSRARAHEKLAWVASVAVAACLSTWIYSDPADFRVLGELWVLTALVLLADPRRRLGALGLSVAALWTADALLRGVFIQ
jgi:hypothetical protein